MKKWSFFVYVPLMFASGLLISTTIGCAGCSPSPACSQDADCPTQGQQCKDGACVPAQSTTCTYRDKTYQDGESFPAGDGCNGCSCMNGQAICTSKGCPKACQYEGKTYQDGDSFKAKDGCNDCGCQDGAVSCTQKSCSPTGKECSGSCADTKEYCHYEASATCGETGAKGTCKAKPTSCDDVDKPVCGCNNKTYANECVAFQDGVSVMKEGPCQGGPAQCGGSVVCPDLQKQYCHFDPQTDACGESNKPGTCKERPTSCDDIDKPVCGCNNKTYDNECLAFQDGTSVMKEGPCQGGPAQCGGRVACPDLQKQYCHFDSQTNACGESSALGACKDKPTQCNDPSKPVCGCDDKTYDNACKAHAAGVSVRREGACQGNGKACGGSIVCADSGDYCHYDAKEACGGKSISGACKPKPTSCPPEQKPVCGCNGQTYDSACKAHAAGTSVNYEGPCCKTDPKACGGYFNIKCKGSNEYCHLEPRDLCGAADAQGTCKIIPQSCTSQVDPVCGCDSKTYDNACKANAAGISVSFKGSCSRPPGSCFYKSASYNNGETFTFRCNTCTCQNGQVNCTSKACPAETCGTASAAPCPTGFYCDQATHCGANNAAGTCKEIRTDPCLINDPSPVCGCDNRTYRSACDAEAAGISVKSLGACKCGP